MSEQSFHHLIPVIGMKVKPRSGDAVGYVVNLQGSPYGVRRETHSLDMWSLSIIIVNKNDKPIIQKSYNISQLNLYGQKPSKILYNPNKMGISNQYRIITAKQDFDPVIFGVHDRCIILNNESYNRVPTSLKDRIEELPDLSDELITNLPENAIVFNDEQEDDWDDF